MNFYQILQSIMDEKGMTVAAVARVCGLSDGTVRSIVTRKQKNVALEVAFKLSDGLGVSLERLNGMPEKESPGTAVAEPRDELDQKLMEQIGQMTPDQKRILLSSFEALLSPQQELSVSAPQSSGETETKAEHQS